MEFGMRLEPTKALEAMLLRASKRCLFGTRAAIIRELQRRAKRDQATILWPNGEPMNTSIAA